MPQEFNPALFVRDSLKQLVPYQPADYADVIKLDANESPFDFPPEIKEQILSHITPQFFTRYPDPMSADLVREIALAHDLKPNQILAGNGSDELILNLMLTFGVGRDVVIATPTFSMYGIHARVAGARAVEISRDDDFNLKVDEIVAAAQKAALVVLCSPNNPTGNSMAPRELEQILTDCGCPVVVDQAYVEFGGMDFLPWLDRHPNLVILRTFSKAYGLAGLRVGYLLGHRELLQLMCKVKQPFNLNVFSQLAAAWVLRQKSVFEDHVRQIIAGRDWLGRQLQLIEGIKVYASDANYILFKTVYPAAEVFQCLLEKKVLIRYFNEPQLNNCLRVSIGKKDENEIFLLALRQVMTQLAEKN